MASLTKLIENTISEYEKWATSNPNALGEIETALKYISYAFTSQFSSSNFLGELVYSLSRLLTFYNDQIIYKKAGALNNAPNVYENKLKKWLTILGHCEVLIELTASRTLGTYGKWIIIFVLQTFKSIIRLFLLLKEEEQIVETSLIRPLDRRNIQKLIQHKSKPISISLRNGRKIKMTEGAYVVGNQTWDTGCKDVTERILDKYQRNAEIMYIMKPLIHLGCMYFCGQKSWKPWIVSFLIDVGSLHMLNKVNVNEKQRFSERQRGEIARRMCMLFMYAMRSPFYDTTTKKHLVALLNNFSRLPIFGILFKSMNECLPSYLETYSYVWFS